MNTRENLVNLRTFKIRIFDDITKRCGGLLNFNGRRSLFKFSILLGDTIFETFTNITELDTFEKIVTEKIFRIRIGLIAGSSSTSSIRISGILSSNRIGDFRLIFQTAHFKRRSKTSYRVIKITA